MTGKDKEILEAAEAASVSLSRLLEGDLENAYYKDVLEDLRHIQNQITDIRYLAMLGEDK